ncbi:putative EF-hand calcium-binding domain-containing protein 11 [Monocercomonoides exilis]|uniref:putative EF-hand calcium-binding domain-containing protein 11 n=1 Tax=Monocercomonoides exilis TaxID=2049356 RepID=UPI00355978C5|nr:putative EF-hand calcium-binding domain-containing protein 11 [Monocercomonoides exilis]|eukprot:MONOS_576.1-p1 / transcript=MONOS_576.1 / gene=MONOS_576 / organism=Monocercomonoides_exilis_PA203 / gene_product=unspecified product / transcript_product=unspecified product / location=Mono_scaffold00009:118154-118813(+) / protein_length=157 / sequence_SO=supercontig / SO=protein_coding / is_pseudo=false
MSNLAGYFPRVFYEAQKRKPPPEVIRQIRNSFMKYANEDKTISRHNFKLACLACFGFKPSKQEMNVIMNGSDFVNDKRYYEIMEERACYIDFEEELRKTFKLLDISNIGFLTVGDVDAVAQKYTPSITKESVQSMFFEADRDKDGRVSFKDFERMAS